MITIKSKGDNGLICKLKGNHFVVMNDVSNAIRAVGVFVRIIYYMK